MRQWLPIDELAKQVQMGEVTAAALVEKALGIIAEKQEYQAIIATTEERARTRAKEVDEKVARGETVGRLAGVPFIAKDNFLAFGADTTAASNMLKGFEAPYQATAIERLEAEGAICVAKANLDAFAHGSSTENSDFMTTKNPHDTTRVPGGSSGGSGAAVALEMAPFALGTDTGGSIRLPASFTGSVGYKPTYGLVSRSGVVAMASSTDVIGPLTMSVDDAALILDVIAGKDGYDSTLVDRETSYTELSNELKGKKVGIIKEFMTDDVDTGVAQHIRQAIEGMERAGAEIVEVSLPSLPLALAVYYIVCPAEVSSNLSRYDGQRFGYSYGDAEDLDQSFSMTRSIGFGKEAKRRIMLGTYVLSSGYYDAYYKRAQTVRSQLIAEFNKVFEEVDVLVGPTAPTTAFKIGENINDPMKMYLIDVMTVAASLVGVPAISIPVGKSDALPVGLQIIGKQRQDAALLGIAKATEGVIHEQ